MLEQSVDIIKHGLMITSFVLIIMLIIEHVNVWTRGRFNESLKRKGWLQIVTATFLGLIPGCLGTFTVVSLYTHNILSFGALIAALISASGDEAFFMFSMIPATAMKLCVVLFVLAIVVGIIVDMVFGDRFCVKKFESHFTIHEQELRNNRLSLGIIRQNFRETTFPRALLLLGTLLFIFGLVTGQLDDNHLHAANELHGGEQEHQTFELLGFSPTWVNVTFLVTSMIALLIICTVPDHFLEEHLWGHIIKKHFLKVLLWTIGALALAAVIINYIDLQSWIHDNLWIVLVVAVLVGVIPESGPHMIFISLFMSGVIPFSILLANSVVQDGHGALPLLAESKKSFFLAKLINVVISLLVGVVGLLVGF